MARKAKAKCLRCRNKVRALGLCDACYQSLRRAVQKGDTTYAEAIKNGACLAPHSASQSFKNRFPMLAK